MARLYFLERDFVDGYKASIKSMSTDGSDLRILHRTTGWPDGIAIDTNNNKIYWSDMGDVTDEKTIAFGNRDGKIHSLSYENGNWVNTVICEGIVTPKQICLHDGLVYFSDREGLSLYRLSTKDNQLHALYNSGDPKTQMFDFTLQNVGCWVRGDTIYITQKGPPKGGQGKILSLPINSELNANDRSDLKTLIADLPEPIDVAFGPQSDKIYWTDRGAEPDGNSLNCGTLHGDKIINHRIIATGFKEAIGLTISADETETFVTDLSGKIYQVNNQSGSMKVIYSGVRLTGIESGPDNFK